MILSKDSKASLPDYSRLGLSFLFMIIVCFLWICLRWCGPVYVSRSCRAWQKRRFFWWCRVCQPLLLMLYYSWVRLISLSTVSLLLRCDRVFADTCAD